MIFDNRAFGDELARVRRESGYSTIADFARHCKCNSTTMWEWELGSRTPRVDRLVEVLRAGFGDRWALVLVRLCAAAYKELP